MAQTLSSLNGQAFDVVVVGAGVNGSSAAQHLAGAGYRVLLVDKRDFCAGSSSRSSRLLHCGLRYLAPGTSAWEFVRHPMRLLTACRMAKQAMACRSQLVRTTPERVREFRFFYPVYEDSPYAPWQVDLAFTLLRALGPKDVPLDYRRVRPAEARVMPLISGLRDFDRLRALAAFREYQFEWPERIAMDSVLDAERLGATVRNYTAVSGLNRTPSGDWMLRLEDTLDQNGAATVQARVVLNMAGIWIDSVNRLSAPRAGRKITGTKGVHIMVRLPPECRDFGIATTHRKNQPFYCVPWRGLHYFGPTETLYEGDIDDIRPTEEEITWLIGEANHLLPSLGLKRSDILFGWAGVRPLTYDPDQPMGARARRLHDLSADGLPNAFALTAGPIMTHRSAGVEALAAVRRVLEPSGQSGAIAYAAKLFPENQNSPQLLADGHDTTLADLRFAAEHEHPRTLADLLFRRTGVAWTATMAEGEASKAAEAVADVLGWDAERVDQEVAGYRNLLRQQHALARP